VPAKRIGVSARIGVDYAGDWAAAPLRFFDRASDCVSKGRRALS
jgi:3-methyladenine DNA glycosylase Mpg